jgi:hypothetical protein
MSSFTVASALAAFSALVGRPVSTVAPGSAQSNPAGGGPMTIESVNTSDLKTMLVQRGVLQPPDTLT